MRSIGTLPDEEHARRFGDYLWAQTIPNEIEADDRGQWTVWVIEEEQIETATGHLTRFRATPGAAEFADASRAAKEVRQQIARESKQKGRLLTGRDLFAGMRPYSVGKLTFALITLCVGVALFTKLGDDLPRVNSFLITAVTEVSEGIEWYPGLPEVRSGQIWRLVTPMLLHFGLLHLLFNMMWIYDLGSMIEARKGPWFLAGFILATAAISNLAQYAFAHPMFGGMSGVVYGVFGYVWMKAKHDPGSGFALTQQTVVFMIIWFFVCAVGLVGRVANWCHGVGLVVGLVWGILGSPGGWRNLLGRR